MFSFGLFGGERTFHVNMSLVALSRKQLEAFLKTQPGMTDISVEAMFPLEYKTTINKDASVDFGGHFERLGKANQ
ncbi:hypothetical protein BOSP111201_13145 [Bordetella sputigena]|uniref:hypothetical protein n=1 Tax=Bordetella sputigena TaxID=1416810 RepID=UPI0039F04F21